MDHTLETPLTCLICLKTFFSQLNFEIHRRGHKVFSSNNDSLNLCSSGKIPFSCEVCSKKFFSKLNFTVHLRAHSNENAQCKCPIGGTTVSFKKPKNHGCVICLKDVSKYIQYQCEVCKKQFYSKLNFFIHQRAHSSSTPFTCEDCHEKFSTEQNLKDHYCNRIILPFLCKICKVDYLTKFGLLIHMQSHRKRKACFACRICHKYFFKKVSLLLHLCTHNKREKFYCGACDQTFSAKVLLLNHCCPPFPCNNCHKRFDSESMLKKHQCEQMLFQPQDSSTVVLIESLQQHLAVNQHKSYDSLLQLPVSYQQYASVEQQNSVVHFTKLATNENVKSTITKAAKKSLKPVFRCKICNKAFKIVERFKEHSSECVGKRTYGCLACEKRFTTYRFLKRHCRKNNEPIIFCQFCDKYFLKMEELSDHLFIHTGDKKFQCKACELMFSSRGLLNVHRTVHSGRKLYVCEHCGMQYENKNIFNKHLLLHAPEEARYQCKKCFRCYKSESSYNKHIMTTFNCDLCEKIYCTKAILTYHQRKHAGDKKYKCNVCSKQFSYQNQLATHLRIHADVRPYTCNICEMRFRQSLHLKMHMFNHTDDKPFKCDICHKGYQQSAYLKYHYRHHTGEQPYICEICGKTFYKSCLLTAHVKRHCEGKPYCCMECNKCFSEKSALERHQYKHKEERPFSCNLCNKSFILAKNLDKHLIMHKLSTEKPFYCDKCHKGFSKKVSFQRHLCHQKENFKVTNSNPESFDLHLD